MGRHHHLRLPEHLYLSPPQPPQPSPYSLASASSFLAVKSGVYYTSPVALFQETGRTTALAVGDRIPGFKTSAAFFNTLRANLILGTDSTPPSLTNTPDSLRPINMASSTGSLPPPSPSPLAQTSESSQDTSIVDTKSENPLDSIPELTTQLALAEDDKVEALHLLADSVAQQRQIASSAVIFHPLTMGILVLLFGIVYQNLYKGSSSDWAIVGTTTAGVLMAVLITVRWLTNGYIEEAEKVGTWKWLNRGRNDDDILLTRFGDEAIGALVLRGQLDNPPSSTSGPRKSRTKNLPTTGFIRGWTVKRRYRRKGVGHGLLEEAVKLCRQRDWSGPEFAPDHANSARVLPTIFNGGFIKRERRANEMLVRVKEEIGVSASGTGKKGKR
ncbi:uncharacterized protein Z518_03234 [Rhinocladiella mackenziei CBS 650.93]|uniref:N-acetyltransferase domain-containing protein n=1 Tax=Rhinocladiella mackenziei CBS 650.93 TaxID=1442369 RepID=A0A0D2HDI3_9EURO|nr:uncharacterized protein Z518_03234 [Rhinocladiella mackenziei CBS 650.93]KIX08578.1 hypothetical protein Z518_03234 [Rhinocladiella mackenziei CBS 650.93]